MGACLFLYFFYLTKSLTEPELALPLHRVHEMSTVVGHIPKDTSQHRFSFLLSKLPLTASSNSTHGYHLTITLGRESRPHLTCPGSHQAASKCPRAVVPSGVGSFFRLIQLLPESRSLPARSCWLSGRVLSADRDLHSPRHVAPSQTLTIGLRPHGQQENL